MRAAFIHCALLLLFIVPAAADDYCLPGYDIAVNTSAPNGYDCKIDCPGGTYLAAANAPECTKVGHGYWASATTVKQGGTSARNKCPDGLTTVGYGGGADEASDCGRILHVGDDYQLYLSKERMSAPGLIVKVNGQNFYAGITKIETGISDGVDSKLVLQLPDEPKTFAYDTTLKDYILEQSSVFDYDDYEIIDGKLISVNQNVYLESTGNQYINTGQHGKTQYKYEFDYKLMAKMTNPIWGMRNTPTWNNSAVFFYSFSGTNNTIVYIRSASERVRTDGLISNGNTLNKVHLVVDIPARTLYYNDLQAKFAIEDSWETEHDLYLFNNNVGGNSITKPVSAKIYYYKVYDAENNVIMHLVPVPRGLQIGDFKVPATGMWDTVTQTYFSNQGTGFFLYGKDS